MTLRQYRPDDLEALFLLDQHCFEPAFRFSRAAMRRFAEAENARTIVAEADGELAGFCILHVERPRRLRVGYVVTLDVVSAHRRAGIARALMIAVEQHAAVAGCTAIVLHVSVSNTPAIRFYEGLGFGAGKRDEGFYGAGGAAIVYSKEVIAPSSATVV